MDNRELFLACAKDTEFFTKTFFPQTFRQGNPPYARTVYEIAESPDISHCALLIFRGGSKTTQAKAILAKRIAYAISRTMLLVSQSEGHSVKTLMWIKDQIERNEKFASFYQLSPTMDKNTGRPKKWSDTWISITNKQYGVEVNIVAVGIEGQSRGLNIGDYRPDFILGDDIADDLNSKNPGPRQDVIDTWTGAIEKSLAPKSENPLAKIMLLQTPIAEGDVVDAVEKDPRYRIFRLGCFVEKEDGSLESAWPARWSVAELLADKEAHIAADKLRMWMREMELQHTSKSNQSLSAAWIRLENKDYSLSKGFTILALDPTPPPKLGTAGPVNEKLDDTAFVAIFCTKFERILLDRRTIKSPSTPAMLDILFDLIDRWKPFQVAVETILFARSIGQDILLEQRRRGIFFPVIPVEDKRAKPVRIVSELERWCSTTEHGQFKLRPFYVPPVFSDVYAQWIGYDGNPTKHDDLVDAVAIAFQVADRFQHLLDTFEGEFTVVGESKPLPALTFEDNAP